MRKAKDIRADFQAVVTKAQTLSEAWDGKEGQPGFDEAMKELRGVLGQADVFKTQLDMALQYEGAQEYLSAPASVPTAVRAASMGREAAPGEGASERQMETTQKAAYKAAFEAYLRKDPNDIGPNDRKTLSEGSDDAGGVFVPVDWQAGILKKQAASPSIRANARVITTSRDMIRVPKVVYTGTGSRMYTSGVRMKWVGELPASSSEHRVTDPAFGSEAITVHTALASMPVTLDLLEDTAYPLEGEIIELLGEAFQLGEEETFWTGTGAGQPQGILTHPMAVTVSATTTDGMYVVSGDASLLTSDGLIALAMELPEQYDINGKWFFNKRSTESAIRKLKSATSGDYMWPVIPQVGNLGPHTLELLGYPVVRSAFAPDIAGNAYPIAFGDMKAYTVVDRVGLSIQRLREVYAETNLVVFLARKRVGGKLMEPYRLKLQKIST